MARAPVTRRLPDANGNLVTFLTLSEVCKLVHVSDDTVCRWARAGAIRFTEKLNGARNYALVDAIRLRLMTSEETRALGIKRTSDDETIMDMIEYEERQTRTLKKAVNRREEWDSYDLCQVIDLVEAGDSHESIALQLGRTYAAINAIVCRLRKDGSLPLLPGDDRSWVERAVRLLAWDEMRELKL